MYNVDQIDEVIKTFMVAEIKRGEHDLTYSSVLLVAGCAAVLRGEQGCCSSIRLLTRNRHWFDAVASRCGTLSHRADNTGPFVLSCLVSRGLRLIYGAQEDIPLVGKLDTATGLTIVTPVSEALHGDKIPVVWSRWNVFQSEGEKVCLLLC